ncbi:hypothetical protein [Variovorax sp. E3]|uniref:hypothetical protein n=1 Tax=Variovorax sp. E3 TaxID=1914993 RepID=UPI0018DB4770|nr:hypothetical protein [Variovorax sp. E3]
MRRLVAPATAAWAAAVLLAGCAAAPGTSRFDYSAGWRSAQIVEIGRAGDLARTADHDCGFGANPAAPYVVVRYHGGGVHTRSLGTVDLPTDPAPRVGDRVYVNILDCAVQSTSGSQRGSVSAASPR